MKKFLLVTVLVLVCLGLPAVPAFAAPEPPQPGNAYVYPFNDPTNGGATYWSESVDGVDVWHDQTEAIPADYPVWIAFSWVSPVRGVTLTMPARDHYAVDLSGAASWSISGAASKSEWGPVYNAGTIPAFNKADATAWQRDWRTLVGVLPSGDYTGLTTEKVTRTITDLSLWFAEQTRPMKVRPGTYTYDFAFTVAPAE